MAVAEVSRSQETLAYAVRFPVSDAEQHHRCLVSAPQEHIETRQGRLPRKQHKVSVPPFAHNSSSKKEGEDKGVSKYVIERDIPGLGNATPDEIRTISQKSCSVLQ